MTGTELDVAFTTDIVDSRSNLKGVANYVRFLTSSFGSMDNPHDVTTVHYESSDAPIYGHELDDLVIDPYPFPGDSVQKLVTNRFRGRRALRDFDVVHAAAPRLYYFPLFASGDYKTVMTVHAMDLYIPEGMEASLIDEPHAWLQQRLMDAYFERVRDDIDAIITVSRFLKDELVEHMEVPPEKVYPVYLAPESHFRQLEGESDRPFILSDTPEPELIELFKRLHDAGFEHELVVFSMRGYGYDRARELVDAYELGDAIEFKGYVPDEELVELYNTADVYVRFAGYEGFGLPPIEAMACGCPVVTTNVGSLPEVVGDAGPTLDPDDVEGFFDEVSSLLTDEDLRTKRIERGLAHAETFSWERTAAETIAIYEEITDS